MYYSESKSGDYKLLKTVKGASTTTFTTKALDSGTTYYFRVRAYKTVSGKNYTGANSAVKSKKTSGTATVKKGSTIKFGEYDWRVLDVKDGKALILTDTVIEKRAYSDQSATWETCDLCAYLNGEFYNSFGKSDKARVVKTKVKNKDNPWYGTSGGKDTEDYIFLLSLEEVVKYFGDSGQLSDRPSGAYFIRDDYDRARMVSPWSGWWLRSPGFSVRSAACVNYYGYVYVYGDGVGLDIGVRPALWITL